MKVILIIVTLCYLIYLSKYNNCKKSKQMQFPEYIKKRLSKSIGIVTPNCPYCGEKLPNFPSRKIKCKNCKNFIYKKTRAFDNASILIKEDEIEKVEDEWNRKRFMLNYCFDDFDKYEKELKKIRKTKNTSFNDVIWYRYEQKTKEAYAKSDLTTIMFLHWDKGTFLFNEKHYKDAFNEYLCFMFWRCCMSGDNFMQRSLTDKQIECSHLKSSINFMGNPGRCIEYLDLSEKDLKKMILEIPLEKGLIFPFSIKELTPYYLNAYQLHQIEKKKFEQKHKTRYLIRR